MDAGLTSCVGDGDRNTLHLDAVDADGLDGLSRRGQLRRVQCYHAPRRGNFSQSPFLTPPRWSLLGTGRGRDGGGGGGGWGGSDGGD